MPTPPACGILKLSSGEPPPGVRLGNEAGFWSTLAALPSTANAEADKLMRQAVKKFQTGLKPGRWIPDTALSPTKGAKVFAADLAALNKLKKHGLAANPAVAAAIASMLEADRALVQAAYDSSTDGAAKVKAQRKLDKADQLIASGNSAGAVKQPKKAWLLLT